MKIIHIIPTLNKGGAERLTLDICNELLLRGHEVLLICLYPENDYRELSSNIDIIVCNVKFFPSLKKASTDLVELQDMIESFKPDVIHSHLFEAEIISRSCIYPNAVYFTHCHNNMFQFENFKLGFVFDKLKLISWYEKYYLIKQYENCTNYFIANSHHTEEYFRSTLPISLSSKLLYLDNAIDYEKFYNSNKIDLGKEIKLINVGSLVDKKNQAFLVDVVEILRNRNVNVTLDILGDGPNKNLLLNKINDAKLSDYIKLHGNVKNVEDYLKQSTLYVHSATYEPFGLVLIEAMAAGLPVVSLDGGGNKEFIYDGENGYLMEENNPVLFADKIMELTKTKEMFHKMSESAKVIAENYNIKSYTTILMHIYKQAIKNGRISENV